jgi:hypothetical protein
MIFIRTILCGVAGLCIGIPALRAGEINGRISITKALTKKKVTLPAYSMRSAAIPLKSESKTVDEFGRLAIYLEGADLSKADPVRTEMIQENLRFLPEFLVVPTGSIVSFPNSDPVFHNVCGHAPLLCRGPCWIPELHLPGS